MQRAQPYKCSSTPQSKYKPLTGIHLWSVFSCWCVDLIPLLAKWSSLHNSKFPNYSTLFIMDKNNNNLKPCIYQRKLHIKMISLLKQETVWMHLTPHSELFDSVTPISVSSWFFLNHTVCSCNIFLPPLSICAVNVLFFLTTALRKGCENAGLSLVKVIQPNEKWNRVLLCSSTTRAIELPWHTASY